MQTWMFREPALCLGFPVYLCAGFLFPLHLGWSGASYAALAAYLALACALFTAADVMTQRGLYRQWAEVSAQSLLTFATLALPAVLLFSIGQAVDHSEEGMEDELCVLSGHAGGSDAVAEEADDSVDPTPDCVG